MRRKDREITEAGKIADIMAECTVCSLALAGGEYPYVVPVNFGVSWNDGKAVLYFHGSSKGEKIERMEADSRASFCMYAEEELKLSAPACGSTMLYSSVCGSGRLSFVTEKEEKYRALRAIMRQYDRSGTEFEFEDRVVEKTAVLKLEAETITGKSNRPKDEAGRQQREE